LINAHLKILVRRHSTLLQAMCLLFGRSFFTALLGSIQVQEDMHPHLKCLGGSLKSWPLLALASYSHVASLVWALMFQWYIWCHRVVPSLATHSLFCDT